jgi:hypothetical protein
MRFPTAILLLAAVSAFAAGDKGPVTTDTSNDRLALKATVYCTRDEVREQLGSDLGGYFIVVKVTLTPKDGKPLAVNRDDFMLRSYKDGQKSQPFQPSQIAGRGSLVIGSQYGGAVAADQGGPTWGGLGGPPMRMPGSGGNMGNTTSDASTATTTVNTGAKEKEDPVLAVLKEKILPEKQTEDQLSGLLYFSLEGKHKPKDLTLHYTGPAGHLKLEFKK